MEVSPEELLGTPPQFSLGSDPDQPEQVGLLLPVVSLLSILILLRRGDLGKREEGGISDRGDREPAPAEEALNFEQKEQKAGDRFHLSQKSFFIVIIKSCNDFKFLFSILLIPCYEENCEEESPACLQVFYPPVHDFLSK